MITVTQTRRKDGWFYSLPTLDFENPLEAVGHLATAELKWGARVTEVTETSIEVLVSGIFGCRDVSIFEGPADEMQPIFELVYFYLEAMAEHREEIMGQMTKDIRRVLGDRVIGFPLTEALTSMLLGRNRLKTAVMLACGITVDEIEVGMRFSLEDIIAAIQLIREGEVSSLDEALV